jgi:hypothetical protein
MKTPSWFSTSYIEARDRFLRAAEAAGATLTSFPHPLRGSNGEPLATDVARIGPIDASKIVLTTSATHGVEGYCGSGCQVGFFADGLWKALPPNVALIQVHGVNPHGFAGDRRVTEENVDLNRNFIDFSKAVPANQSYDEVHEWLVPADWDGPKRAAADAAIGDYVRERGERAFQAAVTGGQWQHADGLFFGGHAPTWSHRTIRRLAQKELAGCEHVAVIDFHTGLGPRGHGELIAPGRDYERAREWYGSDVKNPNAGNSISAVVSGTIDSAYRDAVGEDRCTFVALEYGTLPGATVLQALRADNWLYLHGEPSSELGKQIKRDVRAAFYGEDTDWQEQVWSRAHEVLHAGLGCLRAM